VAMGNVSRQLEEKDGTSVVVSETGRISYQSAEGKGGITKDTARVMNRLVIPRGGEFNLTLSDGTHVWLNAETELRYPVQFNGKERYIIKSCCCQSCKIHRTISDFTAMCEQHMKARLILRFPRIRKSLS